MKKNLAIILTLLLFANSCYAITDNKKIDIDEAIEITLTANPRVKIENLKVKTSENDIKIAGHFKNPELYTYQNIGKTGEGEPQQVGADYVLEILKRGKRQELARSKSNAVSYNQKFREQNLIFNVKSAYINLLLKKSIYHILLEQQELSSKLLKTMEKESIDGKVSKTDVVQAKIAFNRSIMYSNVAKSEVVFAQNYLNSVMNTSEFNYDTEEDLLTDDYEKLKAISPNDTSIDFGMIKKYALENRYDLLKARQDVKTAKANLRVVKSNLIPDVELSGGYAYETSGMSQTGTMQSGAFAGMKFVNLPLIYRYKPEIDNAKIEIQKAELQLEDSKIDVVRDITDAWEKFVIARDNLNFYDKELLQNSRELLKESKESLLKKEIDLTTFLVSKKTYLELILGYEDALGEYYSSYAELLKEINAENIDVVKVSNL